MKKRLLLCVVGVLLCFLIASPQVLVATSVKTTSSDVISIETSSSTTTLKAFNMTLPTHEYVTMETLRNGTKLATISLSTTLSKYRGVKVTMEMIPPSSPESGTVTTASYTPKTHYPGNLPSHRDNTTDYLWFLSGGDFNDTAYVSYDHDDNYNFYYPGQWDANYSLPDATYPEPRAQQTHVHYSNSTMTSWYNGQLSTTDAEAYALGSYGEAVGEGVGPVVGDVIDYIWQSLGTGIVIGSAIGSLSGDVVVGLVAAAIIWCITHEGYSLTQWIKNVVTEPYSGDGWTWTWGTKVTNLFTRIADPSIGVLVDPSLDPDVYENQLYILHQYHSLCVSIDNSVQYQQSWGADRNSPQTVTVEAWFMQYVNGAFFGTPGTDCGPSGATGSTSGMSRQQSSGGTLTEGGASVLVDPSQITVFKGEVFTVNVNVTSVTDLRGWEFKLYWNSTVLNCTNAVIQTPTEWQNNTQNYGPGLEPNYNATHALYWQAEASDYPASSFNGSMTLATLTFQAMQPGTTSLTLADVELANSTAELIGCSVSSGSVTAYFGRYMRSDTQTVNGLGAYVLNIPESTSSASVQQGGVGRGYSWGIRAFIRHSNGSEQEISLDGQTGTPKAVISGGSGLESATVGVAQTGLQPTDSLVIRVYAAVGTSGWTLEATLTTEQLQATTLQAATWTVYYYITGPYNRQLNISGSTFYWGTTSYESRIQNLQYT